MPIPGLLLLLFLIGMVCNSLVTPGLLNFLYVALVVVVFWQTGKSLEKNSAFSYFISALGFGGVGYYLVSFVPDPDLIFPGYCLIVIGLYSIILSIVKITRN